MLKPDSLKGEIKFNPSYRLLLLYDTEKSYQSMGDDTVLGIFDKNSLLDFN